MIPVTKKVQFKGDTHHYTTMVPYAVGGDSLIDRAATVTAGGEVKMLICGTKKGCKRLMSVSCGGSCAIRRQANHQRQVEERKRSGAAAGNEAEQRKRARSEARAEEEREYNSRVRVAHHAAFGPSRDPSTRDPCPHLAKGKCVRGKTCSFSHDHLSTDDIQAITCQVVRCPNGACKASVNCMYHHQDAEPGPSEMICGNAAEE